MCGFFYPPRPTTLSGFALTAKGLVEAPSSSGLCDCHWRQPWGVAGSTEGLCSSLCAIHGFV